MPIRLRDRVVQELLSRGCIEVSSSLTRYRKFNFPATHLDFGVRFYFVGKSGACRVGKTVSGSHSISFAIHTKVKEK